MDWLPLLTALGGLLVGALGAGSTWGGQASQLQQAKLSLEAIGARVKQLEDERFSLATERGATQQRVKQLEETLHEVGKEVVEVEARLALAMEGMEKRLTTHMDRMVQMIKGK